MRWSAEVLRANPDWESVHNQFKHDLDQPSDLPQRLREQVAAVHMLRLRLLNVGASDSRQLAATGFYTERLTRHGSPATGLLAEALTELKGFWTQEKLRTHARQALSAAEYAAEREANCMDCTAKGVKLARLGAAEPAGSVTEGMVALQAMARAD